jgi:hypothetical protein
MTVQRNIIPIYTSRGELGAYLAFPYLFNKSGEWVGWVTKEREVYSVVGTYVGWLSDDPRILRNRGYVHEKPRLKVPPKPKPLRVPASVPLPRLMSEITYATVDVLQEEPERLSTIDHHELKEDVE